MKKAPAIHVRRSRSLALLLAGSTALLAAAQLGADEQPSKQQTPLEKEVVAHAESFLNAFNKGDAKAVAALYAEGAHVSMNGEVIAEGREAIEKAYAELFEDKPGGSIAVTIDSVRGLGPNLAIERGFSRMTHKGNASEVVDDYTAVHSRQDGKWLTATVDIRQHDAQPRVDWKQQLAFLPGKWIAEGQGWRIDSTIEWVAGGNFLKRTFEVSSGDKVESSGVQLIGWDPLNASITSWEFGSDGGHGRGWWRRDEHQWVIESQSVAAGGEILQSTNVISLLGEDEFRWQSTNRNIDGVALENTDSIRVRRVEEGVEEDTRDADPSKPS